MLIKENQLKDVFEINSIPKTDNRGSFSRFFCKKTLSELSNNNSSKFLLFFSNDANTYKFALEDFIVDSKLLDLRCFS